MAVAFTSLASWEHAQDTTAAQEIILAYSERRQCVGDAAIDDLEPGDVKQDTTFWRGMQDWIETNCVKWVDDANFSTATEYYAPADIAYTLATFRTEAGFETDGFRRATEWPTDWTDAADAAYSFGKIVAGDIIGPWIFEDLQKAFDALRWTFELSVDNPDVTYENGRLKNSTGTGTTAVAAYNDAVSNWPASWTSDELAFPYLAYTTSTNIGADSFSHILARDEVDVTWGSIPTHLYHSGNAYYWMGKAQDRTFADIDALGMEDKKFNTRATYASAATASRTLLNAGIDSAPPAMGYGDFWIYSFNDLLILKWEFTNTL